MQTSFNWSLKTKTDFRVSNIDDIFQSFFPHGRIDDDIDGSKHVGSKIDENKINFFVCR